MINSNQAPPFVGRNSSVKAWCVTRLLHNKNVTTMTQPSFDELNFMDGFNLRLDVETKNYTEAPDDIALDVPMRFSFINPMPNRDYKVFLQASTAWTGYIPPKGGPILTEWSTSTKVMIPYVVNSGTYPKTETGFWVRLSSVLTRLATANNPPTIEWAVWTIRFLKGNTKIRAVVL